MRGWELVTSFHCNGVSAMRADTWQAVIDITEQKAGKLTTTLKLFPSALYLLCLLALTCLWHGVAATVLGRASHVSFLNE